MSKIWVGLCAFWVHSKVVAGKKLRIKTLFKPSGSVFPLKKQHIHMPLDTKIYNSGRTIKDNIKQQKRKSPEETEIHFKL